MWYKIYFRPLNWLIETLNPKTCERYINPLKGSIVLAAIRNVHHQGTTTWGLFVMIPWTADSATKSGSKIGIILDWTPANQGYRVIIRYDFKVNPPLKKGLNSNSDPCLWISIIIVSVVLILKSRHQSNSKYS